MVNWTYAEKDAKEQQKKKDSSAAVMPSASALANLDRQFKVKGNAQEYMPISVATDGVHTYMEFNKAPRTQVPLFIKRKNEHKFSIINYKQKDNYYIVDAVFEKAQLRVSEKDRVTIEHTKA